MRPNDPGALMYCRGFREVRASRFRGYFAGRSFLCERDVRVAASVS